MGSNVERGSAFGNFGAGGYSGFLINSFDPEPTTGSPTSTCGTKSM